MLEVQELLTACLTFAVGLVAGYVGERYSVCLVSPVKELLLLPRKIFAELRHDFREFLDRSNYIPIFLGSMVAYVAITLLGVRLPPEYVVTPPRLALLLCGSALMGYFSAEAGGCPFKMHVEAGRKKLEALAYLGGFYAGIIYYYLFLEEILASLPVH